MDTQNPQGNQKALLQAEIGASRVRTDTSSGVMHHKFMVVDNYNSSSDPVVLVGSHNWSSAAENKNDENTLIVHDLNIANQYYQAFAFLYKLSGGVITNPLAVGENQLVQNNYIIYPNLSNGIFNIQSKNTIVGKNNVRIYDGTGKKIIQETWSDSKTKSVNLTLQPSGVYLVVISNASGVDYIKIIKQ